MGEFQSLKQIIEDKAARLEQEAARKAQEAERAARQAEVLRNSGNNNNKK